MRSLQVSGKLSTYSFPKPTLTLTFRNTNMDPSSQFYMDNKNERRMQETKDSIPRLLFLGGNVISTV